MKRIAMKISLICVALCLVVGSVEALAQAPRVSHKRICSLPDVLWEVGKKYDVYFTMEELEASMDTASATWMLMPAMQSAAVHCNYLQPGNSDVTQELTAIQRDVPHFGYVMDSLNPKVVHIYDNRLLNAPAYPLSKPLGPFQFEGSEGALVHALYKQGIWISFSGTGEATARDSLEREAHHTRVRINVQSATVREVLSSYLPADRKQRIMWMARVVSPLAPWHKVAIHVGYILRGEHVGTH
ncbi:MAG TPA: hypothetical protein VF532_03700 [Candidatus Angelobacter sp.]